MFYNIPPLWSNHYFAFPLITQQKSAFLMFKIVISQRFKYIINKSWPSIANNWLKLKVFILGVVNASFKFEVSNFSVIATHSSVYVSFGSIDLVRIFPCLYLVTLFTETCWVRSDPSQTSDCLKKIEKGEAWTLGKFK